jgi:hypothetical protein
MVASEFAIISARKRPSKSRRPVARQKSAVERLPAELPKLLWKWVNQHGQAVLVFRACLKIPRGAVFVPGAGWRGATRENTLEGSSTKEQRSEAARGAKTLRAAGLFVFSCVCSALTARCGDAPASPPGPKPKPLAAAPHAIFRQALSRSRTQPPWNAGGRISIYCNCRIETAVHHPARN